MRKGKDFRFLKSLSILQLEYIKRQPIIQLRFSFLWFCSFLSVWLRFSYFNFQHRLFSVSVWQAFQPKLRTEKKTKIRKKKLNKRKHENDNLKQHDNLEFLDVLLIEIFYCLFSFQNSYSHKLMCKIGRIGQKNYSFFASHV